MKWNELYSLDRKPTLEEMRSFVGEARPLWDELVDYLEKTYQPKQQMDYSKDMLQPGWNIKFRKSGKALCTLYPMAGYFIALVVVGPRQEEAVRADMEAGRFTEEVRALYDRSRCSPLGRWLMIEVKGPSVMTDIKGLIEQRVPPKR